MLIDGISGCFQPFLAILAAGGMIRGLTAFLVFLGAFDRGSGTFVMFDNIGDSVFQFMPVIIGLTAARKFKVNEFVGMLLGAALMNPSLSLEALSGAAEAPLTTIFSGTILKHLFIKQYSAFPGLRVTTLLLSFPLSLLCC